MYSVIPVNYASVATIISHIHVTRLSVREYLKGQMNNLFCKSTQTEYCVYSNKP